MLVNEIQSALLGRIFSIVAACDLLGKLIGGIVTSRILLPNVAGDGNRVEPSTLPFVMSAVRSASYRCLVATADRTICRSYFSSLQHLPPL